MNKMWNPQTECMDRAEITKLQNERLLNAVQYEYDRVPLYKERLDKKA